MALDTKQERHVKIIDRRGNEEYSKLYYHRECWSEIMTQKGTLHNLNTQAMEIMKGIKNKIGVKEEYEIR